MSLFLQKRADENLKAIAAVNRLRRRRISNPSNKSVIDLTTNDYLSLSKNESVIEAAAAAMKEYGTSASGSPLVNGYLKIHEELENALSEWLGFPEAILWNSGFSANESIMSSLAEKGDVILVDRMAHYSLLKGALASGARIARYHHLDYNLLESMLDEFSKERRNIFIVTESLFSMEGDYPDLQKIAELKKRYEFIWIVDEAHGFGWYGPKGTGVCGMQNVLKDVDILVGTLGKALASQGAFTLLRDKKVKDYLINKSKCFLYTTYLAPGIVGAAREALRQIINMPENERTRWQKKALEVRKRLQLGGSFEKGQDSPIMPIVLGGERETMQAANVFYENGLKVAPIRPPSVPEGRSLLRLSLNKDVDVMELVARIERSMRKINTA